MVAFDKAKIKYEYEPQGFDLGEVGWYLPDFYLPQVDMYAEVKGRPFTLQELQKARVLSEESGKEVLLLDGPPARKAYWAFKPMPWEGFHACSYDIFHDSRNWVTEYSKFIRQGDILDESTLRRTCFPKSHCCGYEESESEAVMAARSARFEHGESGPTRISDDDFISHDEIIERAKALQFQDEIDRATEWMRNNPFGHWGVLGRSGKSFKE